MAKTYNTRPYWVRVKEDLSVTEEIHWCEEFAHAFERNLILFHSRPSIACDLDSGPDTRCVRKYISRCADDHGNQYGPTGDYVNRTWGRPDRSRSRKECRDAARDYNIYGETDVIVGTALHRHGARWHWW